MQDDFFKVYFVEKDNEGVFLTESLWCKSIDGLFVVDNIPFVARRISLGDTIKAEFDEEEQRYYFDDFVAVSGNTTVRIFWNEGAFVEKICHQLSEMGCDSEVLSAQNTIAINIPCNINYFETVKKYLEKGAQDGVWTYEESCLAHG